MDYKVRLHFGIVNFNKQNIRRSLFLRNLPLHHIGIMSYFILILTQVSLTFMEPPNEVLLVVLPNEAVFVRHPVVDIVVHTSVAMVHTLPDRGH